MNIPDFCTLGLSDCIDSTSEADCNCWDYNKNDCDCDCANDYN